MIKVKHITYDVVDDYTGLNEVVWGSEKEFNDTYETEEEAYEEIASKHYGKEGQLVEVYVNDKLYILYTKE